MIQTPSVLPRLQWFGIRENPVSLSHAARNGGHPASDGPTEYPGRHCLNSGRSPARRPLEVLIRPVGRSFRGLDLVRRVALRTGAKASGVGVDLSDFIHGCGPAH